MDGFINDQTNWSMVHLQMMTSVSRSTVQALALALVLAVVHPKPN